MALGIVFLPVGIGSLALVFVLGGVQVAIEETLEDSFCAELVEPAQHGTAFGVLATVNGVDDFLSSVMVGLLWSTLGQTVAFGVHRSAVPYGRHTRGTDRFRDVIAETPSSNLTRLDEPTTRGIYYGHGKHPEERGGSVDQ
jgi:hypothetical protein